MNDNNVFPGKCASSILVVAKSSRLNIDGTYTYDGQSGGRPVYRRDVEEGSNTKCLFYHDNWKIDVCGHLVVDGKFGWIFSQGSTSQNPQDAGLWTYYGAVAPDAAISILCGN